MSKLIKGIAASDGVAIAKAYLLVEPDLTFDKTEKVTDVEGEVAKFNSAIEASKVELTKIRNNAEVQLGADKAAIFDAHLLVLDDPELIQPIQDKIKTENANAATALTEVTTQFVTIFESMDNEYMKERAADIRDVSKRVLSHILGVELPNPSMIDESVVIVGNDLTPSDTAQLNKEFVQGFATNIGGRTSHSAIMSRSLEIPAIVGTKSITQEVKQGDMIIVDGLNGDVIINPTEDELIAYQDKRERYFADKKSYKNYVMRILLQLTVFMLNLRQILVHLMIYQVLLKMVHKVLAYIELSSYIWVVTKCQQKKNNSKLIKKY